MEEERGFAEGWRAGAEGSRNDGEGLVEAWTLELGCWVPTRGVFFSLYSSRLKITNWWLWKHSVALGVAGVP